MLSGSRSVPDCLSRSGLELVVQLRADDVGVQLVGTVQHRRGTAVFIDVGVVHEDVGVGDIDAKVFGRLEAGADGGPDAVGVR